MIIVTVVIGSAWAWSEREKEDVDVMEIPAVGAPLHTTRSLH